MPVTQETEHARRSQTSIFDLMERMKMPVLWVCVVIMGGFGVWWLLEDLLPNADRIEEVELGSFEVPGGAKKTYTNLEFPLEAQKFVQQIQGYSGGDPIQFGNQILRVQARDELELAWAWQILRESAKAAGILVTDDVIVNDAKKAGQELTLRDYQRKNSDDAREVTRDLQAVRRFRSAVDEAQPQATWDRVYDRYKTTFEDVRAKFVLFDTANAEIPLDVYGNKEDRAKLEAWLAENPAVKGQKRIPEELDAQVLYVRFKDVSTEELKKQFDARWAPLVQEHKLEVNDEKLRARFDVFRTAWEAEARTASDKWEKEHPAPDSQSATASRGPDRPTEFEFVKDRLRIEYLATRLMEKAFEEVTRAENPLSFEDALQKYGFKLAEITHLDSLRIQQHPDFPTPRGAEPMLRGLREKSLKPGDVYKYEGDALVAKGALEEPGGAVAIWKLTGYHPEREATLDDPGMIEHFTTEYKKKKRQDLAKEEADAFYKAVQDKVNAEIAEKVKAFETAMQLEIDRQIADQKLDRNNSEHKPKILEIENAEKKKKDDLVDAERANVEPNVYQAVCAERALPVRDTGWIAKTSTRNATFTPNDKLSTSEKAEQFFRKPARRTALAALKVGRMGAVESEPNWYCAAVPLLAERREPTPEDLYKLSKAQLTQLKEQVSPRVQTQQLWNYENLKRPEWFNLNVPSLEKSIAERRDADQKRSELKRLQDEQKKKKARARAEKAAQEAMQSRPLFSGEDW
jgi:hypothetical protein